LAVSRVLLAEIKLNAASDKSVVFPPFKFVLPEGKIEVKSKNQFLAIKTGEQVANFTYVTEGADIDPIEAMRLLGVTLYHLAVGKSEHTHEAFLLDGYRNPINSSLWPTIQAMLKGEVKTVGEVEAMIELLNPDDLSTNIQPPPAPASAVAPKIDAGTPMAVANIIVMLATSGMKVVTHTKVQEIWNNVVLPADLRIRYSEAALREALEANTRGEDWRLCYYSGQNPRQMRNRLGTNTLSQPCVYRNDWWLKNSEDYWATKMIEPGYYLLNFNPKFRNQNYETQDRSIAALGDVYERAHEFLVMESALSTFIILNSERLLENWYHWGVELDSDCDRVRVGSFDSRGFGVFSATPFLSASYLRVVLARKFDF
jgi:hypothetical protein